MSFLLGSFTNGLFGGAQSIMQIYGMYQDSQIKNAQIDAGHDLKAAADEQNSQSPSGSALPAQQGDLGTTRFDGATPAGPAVGPVATPTGDPNDPASSDGSDGKGSLNPALRTKLEKKNAADAAAAPTPDGPQDDAKRALAQLHALRGGQVASGDPTVGVTPTAPALGAPAPAATVPALASTPATFTQQSPAQGAAGMINPAQPGQGRPGGALMPGSPPVPTPAANPQLAGMTSPQLADVSVRPNLYPNVTPDQARQELEARAATQGPAAAQAAPYGPPGPNPQGDWQAARKALPDGPTAQTEWQRARAAQPPQTQTPQQIWDAARHGAGADPAQAATSMGSKLLSAVGAMNPIGSAQAAEPQAVGAQPAPPGAPAGAVPGSTTVASAPAPGPTGSGGVAPAAPPTPNPAASALPSPGTPAASGNATQPQQAAAQQTQQRPDPAAGATGVELPASAAPVAPGQTGPTTQSEATPHLIKPLVNQRYYEALSKQSPQWRAAVDKIAEEEHITPDRLAAHWYMESRFHTSSPDSSAGAQGILQVIPSTRDMVDPQHKLDSSRPLDSLRLGARVINLADREFGQNSPGSIVSYFGGPGTAHAFGVNYDSASQSNPKSLAYLQGIVSGGASLGQANFSAGRPPDPRALSEAARTGGPDGFMHYLATTGAPTMQLSDKWRQAETSMIVAATMRGDYAGVAHARDLVLSMSQQGVMQNTMKADQALAAGDGEGAANYLAKAHSFFPDGTTGQFGTDASGNVWAQRVDESDPSRKLGSPFQITREALQATLVQTRDPEKYAKFVNEQQKQASALRLQTAQTANIADEPASRARTAELGYLQHQDALAERHDAAKTRDETRRFGIQTAADSAAAANQTRQDAIDARGNAGKDAHTTFQRGVEKDAETLYGANAPNPPVMADGKTPMSAKDLATTSQLYTDLRSNAGVGTMPGPAADHMAQSIVNGKYKLQPGKDGDPRYGVMDDKGNLVGVVSGALGDRIRGATAKSKADPAKAKPAIGGPSAVPPGTTLH